MDARTYFKTHAKTDGSVMGMFEDKIIQLMEGYATMKVLEKPETIVYRDRPTEDDGPVIKHFQGDCPPPPDDGMGSVLGAHCRGNY